MLLGITKSIERISSFINSFEDCSLPKPMWTHKAHFIVGLWYSIHYEQEEALNKIRENIKKYNVSKRVMNTESTGYHETVTVFYLWAINKFLLENAYENKLDIRLFQDLLESYVTDKEYPFKYYSKELLSSKKAKEGLVNPDLKELD